MGRSTMAAMPASPPGAALLQAINEAGEGVLILVEGVEDEELLASRLTRAEVMRQSSLLIDAAAALPPEMRQAMPEVDWDGLATTGLALAGPAGPARDEALVTAARALVPATLMWMRVYKTAQPDWFAPTHH
jgi:hypothetical protein